MTVASKTDIIYKKWESPSPKAVLLLVHGLGAHTQRWGFLADFFLRNNFSSYALELRGFGESKDLRGHVDSFNIYLDDILILYHIIKKENPGRNVFLVGESMGALLVILTAGSKPQIFNGLICISPVFKDRLHFSFLDHLKIYSSMLYNPRKQFTVPFNAQMCTRDIGYQKVIEEDSREHRLATARLLFETLRAQRRAKSLMARLRLPILFLLAGEDKIIDLQAARKNFRGLKSEDKQIIEYPDMYHSLSIDLGRETVFADILKWLEKRMGDLHEIYFSH